MWQDYWKMIKPCSRPQMKSLNGEAGEEIEAGKTVRKLVSSTSTSLVGRKVPTGRAF